MTCLSDLGKAQIILQNQWESHRINNKDKEFLMKVLCHCQEVATFRQENSSRYSKFKLQNKWHLPSLALVVWIKKINKTRRQPIKQTTEEKSIKKKKNTEEKNKDIRPRKATTDYLTNPCNFKGMKIRSSVLMLYK